VAPNFPFYPPIFTGALAACAPLPRGYSSRPRFTCARCCNPAWRCPPADLIVSSPPAPLSHQLAAESSRVHTLLWRFYARPKRGQIALSRRRTAFRVALWSPGVNAVSAERGDLGPRLRKSRIRSPVRRDGGDGQRSASSVCNGRVRIWSTSPASELALRTLTTSLTSIPGRHRRRVSSHSMTLVCLQHAGVRRSRGRPAWSPRIWIARKLSVRSCAGGSIPVFPAAARCCFVRACRANSTVKAPAGGP